MVFMKPNNLPLNAELYMPGADCKTGIIRGGNPTLHPQNTRLKAVGRLMHGGQIGILLGRFACSWRK